MKTQRVCIGMIISLLTFKSLVSAQVSPSGDGQCYKVPFASSGNMIELTVENGSSQPVNNIRVSGEDLPSWLKLTPSEQVIDRVMAKKERTVFFTFAIDKSAPVNKEQIVTFKISALSGETWNKEIKVAISSPDRFELYQNFPNPFNPSTTISYILPYSAYVTLTIYNLLGQEVAKIVGDNRDAGYHQELWNASAISSGVYLYQLSFLDQNGVQVISRKTLVVVK